MFSKYKKKILLSVAFGAVIFLAFSIYADFDNLIRAFSEFKWIYFPLILLLSLGNYLTRFWRWEYYRKLIKIELTTKVSFLIFMSTFIMAVTPGKMGELLKSYLIREENGTPVSKSAPILIAERLTDFIAVSLLCMSGAFVFNYGKGIVIGVGLFFIACVVLVSSRKFSLWIISHLEKIKFFHKVAGKIYESYESIYTLVKIKPLVIAIGIGAFAWFQECLAFYIVLKVYSSITNVEVSLLGAVFIYEFGAIVGAIAMLPGGLGVTEASMTGLMIFMKIPKDISVASTFIIRIGTLWFSVFVGIISVYFYQRYTNKSLDSLEISKPET